MGNAGAIAFVFFVLGIIIMALAGDASGALFFMGILFVLIGVTIGMISVVWSISGVVDEKTRDWLND